MLEATAAQLRAAGDDSKKHDISCNLVGVSPDPSGNAVLEWNASSESNPNGTPHKVYIDLITKPGTTLFSLAQGTTKMSDKQQIIRNADVKYFCTCKDFQYGGPWYNATHITNSLSEGHTPETGESDSSRNTPPDKRDPERKHLYCKHVKTVFTLLGTNTLTIMKMAKNTVVQPPKPEQAKQAAQAEQSEPNKPVPQTDPADRTASMTADESKQVLNKLGMIESQVKTPEIQKGLDDMAANIEPGQMTDDVKTAPLKGLVPYDEPDYVAKQREEDDAMDTQEQKPYSQFPDYEMDASNSMFDVPLDDDEETNPPAP